MARVVLGISAEHDAGAVLLVDGHLVAAVNEERLTRRKLFTGYPERSIESVLGQAGVRHEDVTAIGVSTWIHVPEEAWDWFQRDYRKALLTSALNRPFGKSLMRVPAVLGSARALGRGLAWPFRRAIRSKLRTQGFPAPVSFVDHHRCHTYSALGTNCQGQTLTMTLDAQGDGCCAEVGWWNGSSCKILCRVPFFDSPAHYYGYVTHLLGFQQMHHEGKVTGLAAHGDPSVLGPLFASYFSFSPAHGHIVNRGGYLVPQIEQLRARLERHQPADIAAGVQDALERAVVDFARHWLQRYAEPRIDVAIAGGVFANVRVNQRIAELPAVRTLSVHQHMGDGGLSYGAALEVDHRLSGDSWTPPQLRDVCLGPAPSDREIDEAVVRSGGEVLAGNPSDVVARLLADGYCGGVCRGRMEYGPRALGHRSILYRADDPTVNQWLNARLSRTEFMPFAPMVLSSRASDYFVPLEAVREALHYMVTTVGTTALCRERAAAVSHVDHTARPQLIDDREPFIQAVLHEFERHTGTPVLVNTSFNHHGEPIVNTPSEAVATARGAGLGFLVLGDTVVMLDRDERAKRSQGPDVHFASHPRLQ
jgi:carbamoyltransferase